MKKLLVIAMCLGLMACAGKVVIPDEPKYKSVSVYADESGGLCFPQEELRKLFENIKALKEYSDQLRGLLTDKK